MDKIDTKEEAKRYAEQLHISDEIVEMVLKIDREASPQPIEGKAELVYELEPEDL